jgi:DNA polymerase I-like protein with 3'-5' exonuclease and polymerase domains
MVSDYIPVGHVGGENVSVLDALRILRCELELCDAVVFHNSKFDLLTIKRGLGLDLYQENWYDTMLMQHMIDENLPSKALDYLGKHHFGEGKEKDEAFEAFINGPGWGFVPIWMMEPYAIQDAKLTLRLFELLYPEFVKQGFDS